MSSTYEYARKEMMRKKHAARRHAINQKVDGKEYGNSGLDAFLPEPAELHCSDCGVVLEGTIRRIGKVPYCRSCYLQKVPQRKTEGLDEE